MFARTANSPARSTFRGFQQFPLKDYKFHKKRRSRRPQIRLRDRRPGNFTLFLRILQEKHRFDIGKSPANVISLKFIEIYIDLTSVKALPRRFGKSTLPQTL